MTKAQAHKQRMDVIHKKAQKELRTKLESILHQMLDLTRELHPSFNRRACDRPEREPKAVCWTCAREMETPVGLLWQPLILHQMAEIRHRQAGHTVGQE